MPDGEWYEVKQGEWLTKIAIDHKFANCDAIWNHPENSGLKKRRSRNILYPGDLLFLPAKDQRQESCPTEKRQRFQVKRLWDTFQLQILDGFKRPVANTPYVLQIGAQKFTGNTNGDGHLHHEKIDPKYAVTASLELTKLGIILSIALGDLNPAHKDTPDEQGPYDNGLSGVQMRLANLGFEPGNTDGVMDPDTVSAITKFQVFEMKRSAKEATGELDDDTRSALIARHKS
jgi:Putative peptidoglycan binding domain